MRGATAASIARKSLRVSRPGARTLRHAAGGLWISAKWTRRYTCGPNIVTVVRRPPRAYDVIGTVTSRRQCAIWSVAGAIAGVVTSGCGALRCRARRGTRAAARAASSSWNHALHEGASLRAYFPPRFTHLTPAASLARSEQHAGPANTGPLSVRVRIGGAAGSRRPALTRRSTPRRPRRRGRSDGVRGAPQSRPRSSRASCSRRSFRLSLTRALA